MTGELLMVSGAADEEAENLLRGTRRRSAQAAMGFARNDLPRLIANEGMCSEAHSMLAETCNWFTEGFHMRSQRG